MLGYTWPWLTWLLGSTSSGAQFSPTFHCTQISEKCFHCLTTASLLIKVLGKPQALQPCARHAKNNFWCFSYFSGDLINRGRKFLPAMYFPQTWLFLFFFLNELQGIFIAVDIVLLYFYWIHRHGIRASPISGWIYNASFLYWKTLE